MSSTRIVTIGDLFSPPITFVVLPGHRRYGWGMPEWTGLWHDIRATVEEPGGRRFLGTIVVRPDPAPTAVNEPAAADEPARLLLVDGQQRLMTVQDFLSVLRVLGDARQVPAVRAQARALTVNPGARTAAQRLKIVPGPADYDSFVDAVVGMDPTVNPQRPTDHPFSEAGHAFASLVGRYLNSTPDPAATLVRVFDTVRDRLSVELLTLGDGDGDEPQTVHDRLNPAEPASP